MSARVGSAGTGTDRCAGACCRLQRMGVVTFGHADSPVVPMLVYTFSKMMGTVERLTARGVATVGVGFPATPLNMARIR